MRIETELDGKTVGAIERHYFDAKEKHPYFCDRLIPGKDYADDVGAEIANNLKAIRERIRRAILTRRLEWDELLNCEVWEVHEAVYHGDKPHAVEECYDCIAVLLRVVDVLEGRQRLGKPKEEA